MANVEIRIPQLGEGLREARLVQFFKAPGDAVAMDEPIFEMETDKAVMAIESPAAGTLASWSAELGEVLPIGATIGSIATSNSTHPEPPEAEEAPAAEEPPTAAPESEAAPEPAPDLPRPTAPRNAVIPPRTRAYARAKGVTDAQLAELATLSSGRLSSDDIDRFLDTGRSKSPAPEPPKVVTPPVVVSPRGLSSRAGYRDVPMSERQRTLNFHLQQSAQQVVPATVEVAFTWDGIEALRRELKIRPDLQASQFLLFAWCLARAARAHPKFRSVLLNGSVMREYDHLNLGIAVARPGDELLIARVDGADAMPIEEFALSAREAIDRARRGEDQANETVQMTVTHMPATSIRMGIPVVVSPSVATLFVGPPFDEAFPGPDGSALFRRIAIGVMTFDHRAINGIGASDFLRTVERQIAALRGNVYHLL